MKSSEKKIIMNGFQTKRKKKNEKKGKEKIMYFSSNEEGLEFFFFFLDYSSHTFLGSFFCYLSFVDDFLLDF